jgi:hypothetical protein
MDMRDGKKKTKKEKQAKKDKRLARRKRVVPKLSGTNKGQEEERKATETMETEER